MIKKQPLNQDLNDLNAEQESLLAQTLLGSNSSGKVNPQGQPKQERFTFKEPWSDNKNPGADDSMLNDSKLNDSHTFPNPALLASDPGIEELEVKNVKNSNNPTSSHNPYAKKLSPSPSGAS